MPGGGKIDQLLNGQGQGMVLRINKVDLVLVLSKAQTSRFRVPGFLPVPERQSCKSQKHLVIPLRNRAVSQDTSWVSTVPCQLLSR